METILLFVIVSLSILFMVLGVQIFFILKDFRKTVLKANKVLDDVSIISDTVSKPVSFLGNQTVQLLIAALAVIFNLKSGKDILRKITKEDRNRKVLRRKEKTFEIKAPQDIEEKTDRPVRRFFRGIPRTFYRS